MSGATGLERLPCLKYVYIHIKRDYPFKMDLNLGGQTAEKYLSNESRMEGVGENVTEQEQFKVVNCKIIKLRKTPLKFCNAKCDSVNNHSSHSYISTEITFAFRHLNCRATLYSQCIITSAPQHR